jgi:glycosyltransferase involved in cell wall biosynthesis
VVLPEAGPLADQLRADGVEVLIRQLGVVRRELTSPTGAASVLAGATRDAFALGRLARKRRVALVHSNTSVVLGGAGAAAVARVPHVWHMREIYSRFASVWPAYRAFLRGSSEAIACVSEATAAQFRTSDRVRVIYDGLCGEPSRAPRPVARSALDLPAETPVVAVVGRISDWKGQDVLVRALADPALRDRGVVGVIAGDAWPGAEERGAHVRQLAAQLGVEDRLRMLGFREDIENVLGAADVVAVPSSAPDPLPGSAVEAAAAGCAVVASASGGLPEIVRDGETGRLIPPGDSTALARTAAELLDDSAQRERLAAAAARDVHERFSASRLLASVQKLYGAVLRE